MRRGQAQWWRHEAAVSVCVIDQQKTSLESVHSVFSPLFTGLTRHSHNKMKTLFYCGCFQTFWNFYMCTVMSLSLLWWHIKAAKPRRYKHSTEELSENSSWNFWRLKTLSDHLGYWRGPRPARWLPRFQCCNLQSHLHRITWKLVRWVNCCWEFKLILNLLTWNKSHLNLVSAVCLRVTCLKSSFILAAAWCK